MWGATGKAGMLCNRLQSTQPYCYRWVVVENWFFTLPTGNIRHDMQGPPPGPPPRPEMTLEMEAESAALKQQRKDRAYHNNQIPGRTQLPPHATYSSRHQRRFCCSLLGVSLFAVLRFFPFLLHHKMPTTPSGRTETYTRTDVNI